MSDKEAAREALCEAITRMLELGIPRESIHNEVDYIADARSA